MISRHALDQQQHSAASRLMRNTVLFADLSDEYFEKILGHARVTLLEDGQVLFEQQSPAKELFLLAKGQIKLARLSPEGHEKIIDLIMPGNSFAEALLFAKQRVYPVTATALAASEVLCFDNRIYADILHQSTDACFSVMAQMSRRLHWQIAEIDRLTLHNATFRVIASRLSITPETLSRTFNKLIKDNLISIRENSVTLNDVGQLRNYAQIDQL